MMIPCEVERAWSEQEQPWREPWRPRSRTCPIPGWTISIAITIMIITRWTEKNIPWVPTAMEGCVRRYTRTTPVESSDIQHLNYSAHLHVKDRHDILVLEVLVDCRRGSLEQTKQDFPVKLDRLHALAENNWGSGSMGRSRNAKSFWYSNGMWMSYPLSSSIIMIPVVARNVFVTDCSEAPERVFSWHVH